MDREPGMELKQILQERRAPKLRPVKTRPRPSLARKLATFHEAKDEEVSAILAANPELATRIRKATSGRHTLVVQSGPWKYHFTVFRKAARLAVYRTRVARDKGADALYRELKARRFCRLCFRAFPRKGKTLFCKLSHAAEYKRLKRTGKLWTWTNLSPEARARKAVADDAREQRERRLDKAARYEQERLRRGIPYREDGE